MKQERNIFTWNDLVIVKPAAPLVYRPGQIAVVCGMEQVKSAKLSLELNVKIGDWIYTIEFGDGSSIDIPGIYLEEYQSE